MPLPNTTNTSKIIDALAKEKPTMDNDQRIAIAYSHARKVAKKRGYIPKGLKHK